MSLYDSLKLHPMFADQPEEQLRWLADHGTELILEPGEALFTPGQVADSMYVILEGEGNFRRFQDSSASVVIAKAGTVTGLLPYSRLDKYRGVGNAATRMRIGVFHKDLFPDMSQRLPGLVAKLVGTMLDRTRDLTRLDERRDKLASLGKLSAGLAHELNNPAAAARRSASLLRETLHKMREAEIRWDAREATAKQRAAVAGIRSQEPSVNHLTSIERSDREEELGSWLDEMGAKDAWNMAQPLVEAGLTRSTLAPLANTIPPELLPDALGVISTSFAAAGLVHEIEQSTSRIFDLVRAIKEYSYMDQAPLQEVDIHAGLENTLTILGHKLKKNGIAVVREFGELPRACAFGSELNQVWTNLIDNAADAMKENPPSRPKQLRIRTWNDGICVAVEIADTGAGIPKEVQSSIFDPFFTTKGVGDGTGLGLDAVLRIVERHKGDIHLESEPGDTRFRVRIPIHG